VGWACIESAVSGRTEHRPTSADYDPDVVRRISFADGVGAGWRLSALATPRSSHAPWKIVVITGAPSWAEYWAPVMAALPANREMIVVDRPGYAASEPAEPVTDIRVQARALLPLLDGPRRQKILLVGQSYGASIAALMAEMAPHRVASLLLLSSYLGEPGPTARWLVDAGSRLAGVIPRDLRNAVAEVSGHAAQMVHMHRALRRLRAPVHMVHGEADDFAPIELARRLAEEARTHRPIRFVATSGANHFINDGPVEAVLGHLEACIPAPQPNLVQRLNRLRGGIGRLAPAASSLGEART
jgi:pimeloyl-ACP methyl ester carboxylesterase